jgi:hypothetical protein
MIMRPCWLAINKGLVTASKAIITTLDVNENFINIHSIEILCGLFELINGPVLN